MDSNQLFTLIVTMLEVAADCMLFFAVLRIPQIVKQLADILREVHATFMVCHAMEKSMRKIADGQ